MTRLPAARLFAFVAAVMCVAPLSVWSSAGAEDPLQITDIDTDAFPEVGLEFTAPVGVTGDGTLSADEVTLLENGVEVPARLVQVPTLGMEVVLVIDTSGSMKEGGAIDAAKNAARRFLDILPPEVPVGVVAFADTPLLASALTLDRQLLVASIDRLRASGETALYDAMVLADAVFSGASSDSQIVLLSDGGNTVGSATIEDAVAVAAVHRSSVVQLTSSEADPGSLQQIAAAGQGSLSSVSDPAALAGLYESIADSLVHRYRLSFTSRASGEAEYRVRIQSGGSVAEATAAVPLPDALPPATTVPPATTAVPADTTPATTPPDTSASAPASTTGEGDGSMWLALGATACFVALLLLGIALVPKRTRESALVLGPNGQAVRIDPREVDPGAGVGGRLESIAERALNHSNRRRGLAESLDVASVDLRPGEFVVLVLIGAVVLGLVMAALTNVLGMLVVLVAAPFLAMAVVSARADRRRRAFDEQLPDVLHLIVSMLRSGYGLPQALDAVANQVAEPAATEFRRVLMEVRIGRDPSDALTATAERMRSTDFRWVVMAIQINREVGGELATILESVAETVRERQRLARTVRSLTAEGRLSALVLTALPPTLVVLLMVTNPGYFAPMKESPGPLLIVIGIGMLTVGWLWMRRVIRTPT